MKLKILSAMLIMSLSPLMALMTACKDNEPWNELPEKISEFINQYFPNSEIDSYSESAATYHVRITDGPGITFAKDYSWESINGYGMPLPQVLLFDQLPPAFYKYLEETNNLGEVFSLERDNTTYTVVLLDSVLVYDIESEQISSTDRVLK